MKVQLLLHFVKLAPNPLARDSGKKGRANVRRELNAILEQHPKQTLRDGSKLIELREFNPDNMALILSKNGLTKNKDMLDLVHEHLETLDQTPTAALVREEYSKIHQKAMAALQATRGYQQGRSSKLLFLSPPSLSVSLSLSAFNSFSSQGRSSLWPSPSQQGQPSRGLLSSGAC